MRHTAQVVPGVLALLLVPLLAGCGSNPDTSGDHDKGHGSSEAANAPGSVLDRESGPSEPAGMICSLEVARAVQRTFALPRVPEAGDGWHRPTYTCRYRLPHGTLRLQVDDLAPGTPSARANYAHVRAGVPSAHRLLGMQSLGLPAFESRAGFVGFLKDGRTLLVDATGAARDLPPGFTKTAAAYGVASAVIACWSE